MPSNCFYSPLKNYPWPLTMFLFCLVRLNYFGSAVASVVLQGAFCAVTLLTVSRWFVSLAPFLRSAVSPNVPAFIWPNTTDYTLDLKAWIPDHESFADKPWATCNITTSNITTSSPNITGVTDFSTGVEAVKQAYHFYTELGTMSVESTSTLTLSLTPYLCIKHLEKMCP